MQDVVIEMPLTSSTTPAAPSKRRWPWWPPRTAQEPAASKAPTPRQAMGLTSYRPVPSSKPHLCMAMQLKSQPSWLAQQHGS